MEAENVSKKRRRCHASSDVNIPHDDIIFCGILPRLPIKSLMRFRSVSKSWCFQISSPPFSHQHLRLSKEAGNLLLILPDHAAQQSHLFLATLDGSAKAANIRFFKTLPQYYLQSTECINGLVCLYKCQSRAAYICNPSIRQLVRLPSSYEQNPIGSGNFYCAFGYEPERKEYKVLRLFGWRSCHRSFEYEIFTLGTNSWRRLDNALMPIGPQLSVCVNGALHWLVNKHRILVFDLKAEKFGTEIRMPDSFKYNELDIQGTTLADRLLFLRLTSPVFIQINECLCLADMKPLLMLNQMELWILKDYKNCVWIKETITFPYCWRASARLFPVGSLTSGEILFIPLAEDTQESTVEILYYDMKRRVFRLDGSVNDLPHHSSFLKGDRFFRSTTICSQSLISLV